MHHKQLTDGQRLHDSIYYYDTHFFLQSQVD